MSFIPARRLAGILAGTVMAVGTGAGAVQAQEFINILTGGTSGVYYPLGVGLSEIYAENIDGARTQVQATKASVENLNLLQQGKGELAFALGDSVKAGWDGGSRFPRPADRIARHRGHLSELCADRRQRRIRHPDA